MTHYVKSHGLGNDYIVIDPLTVPFALTPAAVRLICDRHRGVGSDGILVVAAAGSGDFGEMQCVGGTTASEIGIGGRSRCGHA